MLGLSKKKEKQTEKSISVAKINEIIKSLGIISKFRDLDSILDNILSEARKYTNADAGSIFLVEQKMLVFSYVQNETLFKGDAHNNKYLYQNHKMVIDDSSIAGYVAKHGETLLLDDVHALSPEAPYSYNKSFDENTGYRTKSMLAIPFRISEERIEGVMEIINARDEEGNVIPFTDADKLMMEYFVKVATFALERGKQTRELILRMIEMSKLRDPRETGNHVRRVSAYAIEIYENWAKKNNLPLDTIKKEKDNLRIAAMMHDVGKVAISDLILKKPAKLDEQEYEIMKSHTVLGARLFTDMGEMDSENSINPLNAQLDTLSAIVALSHHERWDGKGYPGKIKEIHKDPVEYGEGKKGREIHWAGRIVALADVYDALMMKRVYKEPWSEEKVKEYIQEQKGTQFDPEMVESFFDVYETIEAIRKRFSDDEKKD